MMSHLLANRTTTQVCNRYLPMDLPAERVAARIGLVSDTHMPVRCPALPLALFKALRGVDLLLHAWSRRAAELPANVLARIEAMLIEVS